MSVESVVLSNHFTLCCPLLLSLFPSIRVFFNDSALCIRRPKQWSFSSSPSNEYSQLIFFRIDWFDSLTVQGTLKSLQHHSLKASVLQHSAFFMVQLSHPYISHSFDYTIGKVISLFLIHYLGLSQLPFKGEASFNFMAAVTICSDFGA